jgi:hypothetical protein
MPVTHQIKITTTCRGYVVAGAIALKVALNPVRAAAVALLEAGHDPADTLAAVFEGVSLSPVALHGLVRPYTPPRAAWGAARDAARAAA